MVDGKMTGYVPEPSTGAVVLLADVMDPNGRKRDADSSGKRQMRESSSRLTELRMLSKTRRLCVLLVRNWSI